MQILKYPLNGNVVQCVAMPQGARVLSLQMQGDLPHLWALCDEAAPTEPRMFCTYGPQQHLPENIGAKHFIGTYQLLDGALVLHVFEM